METTRVATVLAAVNTFNFLASLINGNSSSVAPNWRASRTFNFLASLINGNYFDADLDPGILCVRLLTS